MGMNESFARHSETGLSTSGVITSDTAVKAAPGKVYWITASCESASVIQLNDSTDDSGTDKWQFRIPDNGHDHVIFDPPIECATGIYIDIPAGEPTTVVGYI